MSQYVLLQEMKKLLKNLDACLDKAVAFASTKKFDPNTLLQTRLAPDMLPFVFQVRAACDAAKFAAARTAAKEVPSHPDTEASIDDLKKRIATVVAFLDTFTAKDFESSDSNVVTTPRWEGKTMTGTNYFAQHALPNFFFHLSMAYALLRHNGVDIGKRDYLGELTYR
jgi:hypothetical protein